MHGYIIRKWCPTLNKIEKIYQILLKEYGHQQWWPLINPDTLLCEYKGGPKTDAERFEVCIGSLLTQNAGWYPGVVRALQQLKLGRPFTEEEKQLIEAAEIHKGIIREKPKKQTTDKILTQNTAWPNVEKALLNLKKLNAINPIKILSLDEEKLKNAIKPAGYFNQKAKKLKIFSEFYISLKGKTPKREELLKVWGIGPETADSILLYAYPVPVFVVDAYTKRIFSRIGLIKENATYDEIQKYFYKNLKSDYKIFNEYHALIVEHAKRYCKNKKECKGCVLDDICRK